MTKAEVVAKLEAAVGGTPYGDAIVNEAKEVLVDGEKPKYYQNMVDRLHERIGVLQAYERIHRNAGEEAKAAAEEDKIAIVEKALAAIK